MDLKAALCSFLLLNGEQGLCQSSAPSVEERAAQVRVCSQQAVCVWPVWFWR